MKTTSRLEREFLDDRQQLTRGFRSLIDAVEKNDTARQRQEADVLDRIAGPHIEFEEHVLYPRVRHDNRHEFHARLLREHQVGRSAIRFLQSQEDERLSADDRARVLEQLRVGLDHAVTSGSPLSHLTEMSDEEQEELLRRLQEFRGRKMRWTELDGRIPAMTAE